MWKIAQKVFRNYLVLSHGLTDPGRLQYILSFGALSQSCRSEELKLDPSIYFYWNGNNVRLLVVQVYDHFYIGTSDLVVEFDAFQHKQYQRHSTKYTSFSKVAAWLTREKTDMKIAYVKRNPNKFQHLKIHRASRYKDRPEPRKDWHTTNQLPETFSTLFILLNQYWNFRKYKEQWSVKENPTQSRSPQSHLMSDEKLFFQNTYLPIQCPSIQFLKNVFCLVVQHERNINLRIEICDILAYGRSFVN